MTLCGEVPRFPVLQAFAGLGWFFVGSVLAVGAAAPTGIGLSSSVVAENAPPGTLVGVLTAVDTDLADSHGFSLVGGAGAGGNDGFSISGNQLVVADEGAWRASFDFELQQTYPIRVRVTDSTGLLYEQQFIIQMSDDLTEDVDGDSLDQAEEFGYGSSDALYDSDGDGFGDGIEVSKNSSPTDIYDWPDYPLVTWGDNRSGEPPTVDAKGFSWVAMAQRHSLGLSFGGVVEAWGGANPYGQTSVPAGLDEVVEGAAGGDFWPDDSSHSLALKGDGTVVRWGYQNTDLSVPEGLGEVVGIASGRAHNLGLKSDGTVVAWGRNFQGESTVPPGLSDVVAIAADGFYSLALKGDGTVVAWGEIYNGQTWERPPVPSGLSDVVAISAGRFHSLALRSDGTVVAWGNNECGQATVPAGLDHVVAIAAGGFHSLALKDDGSVVGWGYNQSGQVTIPVAAGVLIRGISTGLLHSVALRQTGDSPGITSSSKIIAAAGTQIAHPLVVAHAIPSHFSALGLPDGLTMDPLTGLIGGTVSGATKRSIQIMVDTDHGRLTQSLWLDITDGLPPTEINLSPATFTENSPADAVVGNLTAVDPDEGDSHTFELVAGSGSTDNGRFLVSGNQLVVNGTLDRDFEANPAAFSIRVRVRDASMNRYEQVMSVQFLDDGQEDADRDGLTEAAEENLGSSDLAYDTDSDGFGDGFELDRGTSPLNPANFPNGQVLVAWGSDDQGRTAIPPGLGEVIGLAAGGSHNLVLKSDGTVVAWGSNSDAQCDVPAGLDNVVAVEAGGNHSLALIDDGTVVAWGNHDYGQGSVPQNVTGVVAIAAGNHHNLALMGDGTVVAWGADDYGQSMVPAGLSSVVAIAAGGAHSIALKSDGTVVVWGAVSDGTVDGLEGVTALAAGSLQSVALKAGGTVAAWGNLQSSQVSVPSGLVDVVDVKAGWGHGMALQRNGAVVAWGDNASGQAAVPPEARNVQMLAAGAFHNLALCQAGNFPKIEASSTNVGWPGEQVTHQVVVSGATPSYFTAMGLPAGLVIDPLTGLISGTVTTGAKRAARISVDTDKGRLNRVLWFDTAVGAPPVAILLSPASPSGGPITVRENSPQGTLVGTLAAIDPNVGDVHTFHAVVISSRSSPSSLETSGNQLLVRSGAGLDFESNGGRVTLQVRVTDSAWNYYDQNFEIVVTDDRTEDADGDGVDEATEEDLFFTSDVQYDDLTTADADADGVPTLIEYAFNLNLNAPDGGHYLGGPGSTAGLPIIYPVVDGQGGRRLRMEYLRRIGSGLTYRPEFASGLSSTDWALATQPVEVTPINLEWERCVIDDDQPAPGAAARFGRIAVSR